MLSEFRWYRRWRGGRWYRVRTDMHPQMEFWVRNDPGSDEVIDYEDYGLVDRDEVKDFTGVRGSQR